MKISSETGVVLGFMERDDGVRKDGTSYSGYKVLSYVVEDETSSRKFYLPDNVPPDLLSKCRKLGQTWLSPFYFSGEIDAKGNIVITDIQTD